MRLNIDFIEKIIYADEFPLTKMDLINTMLEAGGYTPEEFTVCAIMNAQAVQFENDNTADLEVFYEAPKNEIN